MTVHKLKLEDYYQPSLPLIAIHSSYDDYRLVYLINQKMKVSLQKTTPLSIQKKAQQLHFDTFLYENKNSGCVWRFLSNKTSLENSPPTQNDLFAYNNQPTTQNFYLIPEYKKVDFFLKIENNFDPNINQLLIQKLQNNPIFTLCYEIDWSIIKSKQNILF